jgi:glycosyltransferase involved in cell wall biosynthesis
MRSSMVWAHPSWATPYEGPFFETSCIGAMEAQAAGCLAVASNWGALPETIRTGRLIGAEALSPEWQQSFVDEIVDGLTNRKTQQWAQVCGPERMADMGWDGAARQVAGLIDGEAFAFDEAGAAAVTA